MIYRILFVACVLLSVTAQASQWCSTMSCPACPRHGLGSGYGHECFSSQSACESAVASAKRAQGSGATYSACTEEGSGSNSTPASTGDPAQDLINQGVSGVVDGMMNGNADSFAMGAMGIAGGIFVQGMKPDPAAEARRQQEAAEAAARQAAYERQLAIEAEARNQQLMSEMLGDDVADPFSSSTPAPAESSGLGLMSDDAPVAVDNNRGFMPAANKRPAIRTHGNAVLKQPEPVDSLASQVMSDAQPATAPAAPAKPQNSGAALSAFNKGFDQGIGCYSHSAFAHCASEQDPATYQLCIGNYDAGYRNGEAQKQTLLAQAHQAGALDKQQGRGNNSFAHPSAQGSCRVQWIERYNSGYQGVP